MKIKKQFSDSIKRLKNQAGQTSTEYMLIIAVVVLGAVAGASYLIPEFKEGVVKLAEKITSIMDSSASNSQGIIEGNDAK